MRRIVVLLCAVVAAVLPMAGSGSPAAAQTSNAGGTKKPTLDELQKQRDAVRRQKAAAAGKVDALKADTAAVTRALADLNANVATVQHEFDAAQAEVDAVQRAADDAKAAKDESARKVSDLEKAVKMAAVRTYTAGGAADPLLMSSLQDATDALRRQTLMAVAAGDSVDLADKLDAAKQDFAEQERVARESAAQLAIKRDAVDVRLKELDSARDQQAAYADQLDDRLDSALSESASLASVDKKLSDQIAAEQKAIADALAKLALQRNARSAPSPVGTISLQTVRGITVAAPIADNLEAMLAAAERAGVSLGGSGYRDSSGQIAVRRTNCGTSDYAIYSMPSSSCHPPTARPGTSQHERGLAIDFTTGGFAINSRGSAAYQWLANNAAKYGFYNLPSEPWHWSTTGN